MNRLSGGGETAIHGAGIDRTAMALIFPQDSEGRQMEPAADYFIK
ncbi:MAG: hypothetical protein P3X23_005105 [Thermosynechococcus sp. Uc]|nr:hypothetical protein [Thermosynechococcus sp. Uc]MDM7326481.1 hypothetical protein [Thermosynechococcus sp. Uc]